MKDNIRPPWQYRWRDPVLQTTSLFGDNNSKNNNKNRNRSDTFNNNNTSNNTDNNNQNNHNHNLLKNAKPISTNATRLTKVEVERIVKSSRSKNVSNRHHGSNIGNDNNGINHARNNDSNPLTSPFSPSSSTNNSQFIHNVPSWEELGSSDEDNDDDDNDNNNSTTTTTNNNTDHNSNDDNNNNKNDNTHGGKMTTIHKGNDNDLNNNPISSISPTTTRNINNVNIKDMDDIVLTVSLLASSRSSEKNKNDCHNVKNEDNKETNNEKRNNNDSSSYKRMIVADIIVLEVSYVLRVTATVVKITKEDAGITPTSTNRKILLKQIWYWPSSALIDYDSYDEQQQHYDNELNVGSIVGRWFHNLLLNDNNKNENESQFKKNDPNNKKWSLRWKKRQEDENRMESVPERNAVTDSNGRRRGNNYNNNSNAGNISNGISNGLVAVQLCRRQNEFKENQSKEHHREQQSQQRQEKEKDAIDTINAITFNMMNNLGNMGNKNCDNDPGNVKSSNRSNRNNDNRKVNVGNMNDSNNIINNDNNNNNNSDVKESIGGTATSNSTTTLLLTCIDKDGSIHFYPLLDRMLGISNNDNDNFVNNNNADNNATTNVRDKHSNSNNNSNNSSDESNNSSSMNYDDDFDESMSSFLFGNSSIIQQCLNDSIKPLSNPMKTVVPSPFRSGNGATRSDARFRHDYEHDDNNSNDYDDNNNDSSDKVVEMDGKRSNDNDNYDASVGNQDNHDGYYTGNNDESDDDDDKNNINDNNNCGNDKNYNNNSDDSCKVEPENYDDNDDSNDNNSTNDNDEDYRYPPSPLHLKPAPPILDLLSIDANIEPTTAAFRTKWNIPLPVTCCHCPSTCPTTTVLAPNPAPANVTAKTSTTSGPTPSSNHSLSFFPSTSLSSSLRKCDEHYNTTTTKVQIQPQLHFGYIAITGSGWRKVRQKTMVKQRNRKEDSRRAWEKENIRKLGEMQSKIVRNDDDESGSVMTTEAGLMMENIIEMKIEDKNKVDEDDDILSVMTTGTGNISTTKMKNVQEKSIVRSEFREMENDESSEIWSVMSNATGTTMMEGKEENGSTEQKKDNTGVFLLNSQWPLSSSVPKRKEKQPKQKWKYKEQYVESGFVTIICLRHLSERKTIYLPFIPYKVQPLLWQGVQFFIVLGYDCNRCVAIPIDQPWNWKEQQQEQQRNPSTKYSKFDNISSLRRWVPLPISIPICNNDTERVVTTKTIDDEQQRCSVELPSRNTTSKTGRNKKKILHCHQNLLQPIGIAHTLYPGIVTCCQSGHASGSMVIKTRTRTTTTEIDFRLHTLVGLIKPKTTTNTDLMRTASNGGEERGRDGGSIAMPGPFLNAVGGMTIVAEWNPVYLAKVPTSSPPPLPSSLLLQHQNNKNVWCCLGGQVRLCFLFLFEKRDTWKSNSAAMYLYFGSIIICFYYFTCDL